MRSIVWLMTLGLVTAAVAMVATVEYQRRCWSLPNRNSCGGPPCVTDLPPAARDSSDLPDLLQGLGILSARIPQSDTFSVTPAFQPRPDLAGVVTPQQLAELEQISRITASALVVQSQSNDAVTEDEFTFPQSSAQPPAPTGQPVRPVAQTRDEGLAGRLGQVCLNWTNHTLNALHCRWQTFCLWLKGIPILTPTTADAAAQEPPKLPGLLADAELPLPATTVPERTAVAEPASQVPFLAAMQVVLGVPVESALADGLSSLFESHRSATVAKTTTTDRSAYSGALAAWNAELADDGNAVIQATYTALEPAQVEVANQVVVARFYPITDALASGQTVEQVIAEICQQVSPRSWSPHGGLGTVVYYAPGRTLVIRQTPAVHSELERFFNQKRQPLPQPMPPSETEPETKPEAKGQKGQPDTGKVELAVAVSARRGLALEIVVCDSKDQRTVTAKFPLLGSQRSDEPPCCRPSGHGSGCAESPCPITSGRWACCPKDGPASQADVRFATPEPGADKDGAKIVPVQHLGPLSPLGSAPGPWWRLELWQQRSRTGSGAQTAQPLPPN